MPEPQITKDTRWWVMLDGSDSQIDAVDIYSDEQEAMSSMPEDSEVYSVIQVRPVLPGDVSEFRRGVEATRKVVSSHYRDDTIMFVDIDKLLAENPEVSADDDSAAD